MTKSKAKAKPKPKAKSKPKVKPKANLKKPGDKRVRWYSQRKRAGKDVASSARSWRSATARLWKRVARLFQILTFPLWLNRVMGRPSPGKVRERIARLKTWRNKNWQKWSKKKQDASHEHLSAWQAWLAIDERAQIWRAINPLVRVLILPLWLVETIRLELLSRQLFRKIAKRLAKFRSTK